MKKYQLDEKEASQILQNIFEQCEMKQNTIPFDTLLSYGKYRKERYALQKRILVVMMILFILLPLCFLSLTMNISKVEDNYLTLYQCEVNNKFPIKKISAVIDDKDMPVYEKSEKNYIIKATKNGTMTVTVQLWNGQLKQQTIEVTECDENAPQLLDSYKENGYVYIYLSDDKTGVKYDSAYALDANNQRLYPDSIDTDTNCIVFSMTSGDIYVSDYAGNKLHITVK